MEIHNDIDDEWDEFINSSSNDFESIHTEEHINKDMPKCGDIYISTKTKIIYMKLFDKDGKHIKEYMDISGLFWKIPIIEYYTQKTGIIKKQIKLTSFSEQESNQVEEYIKQEKICQSEILQYINKNTDKSSKYKKVQKISCGLSKKDFITTRTKKKSAFYNCFALVIRVQKNECFKELHIKVFNSGKIEIPGIQDEEILEKGLSLLQQLIENITSYKVKYDYDTIETVLINSNFTCGYYINREKLFNKLKMKYGLITMYDPCSYPGIQSKFYYNKNKKIQNGLCECSTRCSKGGKGNGDGNCIEVSFMIFRTGSVLIVGRCNENILYKTYEFIKNIFENEYQEINNGIIAKEDIKEKVFKKSKKIHITIKK